MIHVTKNGSYPTLFPNTSSNWIQVTLIIFSLLVLIFWFIEHYFSWPLFCLLLNTFWWKKIIHLGTLATPNMAKTLSLPIAPFGSKKRFLKIPKDSKTGIHFCLNLKRAVGMCWRPFLLSKVSALRSHGVTMKQSLFDVIFCIFIDIHSSVM